MCEGNEKTGVVGRVGDRIDVLLRGRWEMELAGTHANDNGAIAGGFEDRTEYGVLLFLRCRLG